jgi:phosphoribosylanthranilate isomerase
VLLQKADKMTETPHRTRIKICGIRDPEMGRFAVEAGADAIGMVFYAPSPRAVDLKMGVAIKKMLPTHALSVALFVNPDVSLVQQVIADIAPSVLQFHGDESAEFCAQFKRPFWKAARVAPTTDLLEFSRCFARADRLLLDADAISNRAVGSNDKSLYGGTGEVFDWDLIPAAIGHSIVLSGGLTVANVAGAIGRIKPWAVDVSSGVERQKGVKSQDLIQQFIQAVQKEDIRE